MSEIYAGAVITGGCAVLHVFGLMSIYYRADFQIIGAILARLNSKAD
jgi:hypothetical protein